MSEQGTTKDLSTQAENELICEKLLGLKKHCDEPDCTFWRTADGARHWGDHSFDNWADAGLILDQFESRAPRERVDSVNYKSAAGEQMKKLGILLSRGELQPPAIRAAALEYIRSLP